MNFLHKGRHPYAKLSKIINGTLSITFLLSAAGCASVNSAQQVDVHFQDISKPSANSDITPCNHYSSRTNYLGMPYYVRTFRDITRHEGTDFCTRTGADVIAPVNGTVVEVVIKNENSGGWITIHSKIKHPIDPSLKTNLYVTLHHITPKDNIKNGDNVKAGELVGVTEPGGKPAIGPRSHVHLELRTSIMNNATNHVNPSLYWQKGPGVVSCFDSENPPSDSHLVAPVKCKSKAK